MWVGEIKFEYEGKQYNYKGEIYRNTGNAVGFGVATCINDARFTIEGTF